MKKLSKIKLQEAAILNDNEMKMVLGGSGSGGSEPGGSEASGSGADKPWFEACVGKNLCDPCSYKYEGKIKTGRCSQNAWNSKRYCSDLNCHY